MRVLNYFNLRTFLTLAISQIAAFLAIHFQIKFHLDLLLFSLCVVFPLHFSMQAAFKRRDKALEYFSLFKAGAMALYYSFRISEDLSDEKKREASGMLKGVFAQLTNQLENRNAVYEPLQRKLNALFSFIETHREEISKRNAFRMVRYMKDVTDSSSYLISLVSHRTMAGLRFYSILFIVVFPLVQAPIVLYRLESIVPSWAIYIFLALSSLILVTLSNFQLLIEYPFDKKGMDNINLQEFSLDIEP